MDLPSGIIKRGRTFYVKHKHRGKWVRTAVGQDLDAALEACTRLRGPVAVRRASPTVDEISKRWLAHQRVRSKATSVKAAETHTRMLLKHLRGRRVDSLRSADIEEFIEARRKDGVKALSINNDLRILKAMLRWAASEGMIPELPTRIKLLRCVTRRSLEIFTPNEIDRVLNAAEPRVRVLLTVASATGLRLDELLHLRWHDIDLRDLRINVTAKQYKRRRRDSTEIEEYWSPKSHAERAVFITPEVVDELRRFRMKQKRSADSDWVLQGKRPGDRWISPAKAIRAAFTKAGKYEPHKLTHAIRHTVATRMLQGGVDLETVRDVLGHADVTTTARYLHVVDDRKRNAAKAIGLLSRR